MALSDDLIRYRQMAQMLSLCGYYHLFKLGGNLIDSEGGVLEQRISQLLARRILEELDLQVTVSGLERARDLENHCVICSHASHLDWAVLLGYFPRPLRFIAKRELTAVPVIGSYLKLRGVLIDRRRGQNARAAISAAARDGSPWPILIFAEGTRTSDGALQPLRRGGLRVLVEAGLTLLPVSIRGTYEAFSRHARYIRTGGQLDMAIGRPLAPDPDRGPDEMMDTLEARLRRLHQRER